jgi:hypothetical protein
MKRLILIVLCVLCSWPVLAAEQTAVVTRNVNLRIDASTDQAPIRLLRPPTRVTVLDQTLDDGYLHVKTAEGQEGWVWAANVRIEDVGAPTAPAGTPADAFSTTWARPTPNRSEFTSASGTCGPTGDGGDTLTNARKNRTDLSSVAHDVTFHALASLPYPKAPKSRTSWTSEQLAEIEPYEGVAVRLVGYLVALKPQSGGSGESCNCHFTAAAEVDWHIAIVETPGRGEAEAVVVETTPRVRKNHPGWTVPIVKQWVDESIPVRITGWTMLDPEHRNHLDRYRSTLWEIHPITKIEVLLNEQWVDIDTFGK